MVMANANKRKADAAGEATEASKHSNAGKAAKSPAEALNTKQQQWQQLQKKRYAPKRTHGYRQTQKEEMPPEHVRVETRPLTLAPWLSHLRFALARCPGAQNSA